MVLYVTTFRYAWLIANYNTTVIAKMVNYLLFLVVFFPSENQIPMTADYGPICTSQILGKKKKLKNENKAKKEVTGDTISEVHKRQAH